MIVAPKRAALGTSVTPHPWSSVAAATVAAPAFTTQTSARLSNFLRVSRNSERPDGRPEVAHVPAEDVEFRHRSLATQVTVSPEICPLRTWLRTLGSNESQSFPGGRGQGEPHVDLSNTTCPSPG